MDQLIEQQPPIVIWLLGASQSGKTSIIRVLTGSSLAEIGNGFQPCTRTAKIYNFPPDVPILSFLDTRGLGEVEYEPSEDIAVCEARAHLLVVVAKASDCLASAVFGAATDIRKRHPDWPVVVVQTCLHEFYPVGASHPEPYPFGAEGSEESIPIDLLRGLEAQRSRFSKLPGKGAIHFVPIDFTLVEDALPPVDYGIDALWAAIEESSQRTLQRLLRTDGGLSGVYLQSAHGVIAGHSVMASAAGGLPLVDLGLVTAIQANMIRTLALNYKIQWTARHTSEFLGIFGVGFGLGYLLRWGGRTLIKGIPGGQPVGIAIGAISAGAITYGLGRGACVYLYMIREGHPIEAAKIKAAYRKGVREGRLALKETRKAEAI